MGRIKQVSDDALLTAAREIFAEKGFGASTREIARHAGISEAVLYQRHKTKLDLFFAAMVPPPIDLEAGSGGGADQTLLQDLGELATQIMAYFRGAMPVLLQLVTHPSFSVDHLAERQSHLPLNGMGAAVLRCLERHRAKGHTTHDVGRVQAATLTLMATLHSLALFERMGIHGGSFPEHALNNIVNLIAAGLAPDKGD